MPTQFAYRMRVNGQDVVLCQWRGDLVLLARSRAALPGTQYIERLDDGSERDITAAVLAAVAVLNQAHATPAVDPDKLEP